MSQAPGDVSDEWSDEGDSWDEGSLPSGSDSDCSLQGNQYHRLGGLSPSHPNNERDGNPRLVSPDTAVRRASGTASTSSTACDLFSYTTRAESGISSISPRTAAGRQPTGVLSESSTDSILVRFASHSTSTVRQISCFSSDSTLYLNTTDSEGTGSGSLTSNTLVEDDSVDTPDTSEADFDDLDFFGLDGALPGPIPNRESLFAGLEFPEEYRRTPSSSANSESDGDYFNEILELCTNPQARPDATLWAPSADTLTRPPDPVEIALAPSPGLAYNTFHSPMRHYTQGHDEICRKVKATPASFLGQASSIGSPYEIITGKSKANQHIPLLVQSSGNRIVSRHIVFQTQHNTTASLEWLQGDPKSQICTVADLITDSLNYQVSIFHPGFLVSHLSESSVSILSAELCTANTLTHTLDHFINLSLGFGPDISLYVVPFVPKNKEALRSFRRREGRDKLSVQDSLPIALDVFSIESMAETLDDWLGGIIDSPRDLPEYLKLMMKRHKKNLSVEVLQVVVSWLLETRSELLHGILRTALKLLLTTSILSMVPRVTSLSSSLSDYLSLDSSTGGSPVPSYVAPKLLTRQIKASTYHLQKKLLHALFSHFMDASERIAQIRLSVALIVSFVLELVRNAGREFARFANTINNSVFVEKQQVKDYERNIESVVFESIRASVYDSPGCAENRVGELGDRLRSLKSIRKGKGKEDKDCQFVSAILTPVL